MRPGLQVGHAGELTWSVDPQQTITLGQQFQTTVFSTPSMINLMEHAAREALGPYLEPNEESVGTALEVTHLAATPLGEQVRGVATVTELDGRNIGFDIAAFDRAEQIGRGTHRRAIITMDRFQQHLAQKVGTLPATTPGLGDSPAMQPNSGDLPSLNTLIVEQDGPVAIITLNRPQSLNAVDMAMTGEIEQLVGWLAGHEDQVRVVIVAGAGRAFCAGDDVKEVATLDMQAATALSHRQAQMYLQFEKLGQPIIAAINGSALGGGCVFAYSCDFRIAVHGAIFGMPEIKLGWPPGYGVAQLTALVGKARALELCMLGNTISAQQALAWGLVHEVTAQNSLMDRCRAIADALLQMPPAALRETKRLVHADEGSRPKLTFAADTAAYIRCLDTDDAREGIAAFTEKRPAKFKGS